VRATRESREAWIALLALLLSSPASLATDAPDLVVLSPAGANRDSLPVLQVHPRNAEIAAGLSRGFGRTMLRLFRMEQAYLHEKEGREVEPAYLLLSKQQGGFPRTGFVLDQTPKPNAGYVDLHERSRIAGEFGAMDQIFPHELAHVIQEQLAGKTPSRGTNQIHAVGVCTDPATAFSEGFAEHFQVMACDDPEVDAATRAVVKAGAAVASANRNFTHLQRELGARLAFCPRARMTFLLWFSQAEQALRYSAVKANAFAFTPAVPEHLLHGRHVYESYLIENLIPGTPASPASPRKSLGRLLSTEGVVSAFFCRLASNSTIRDRSLGDDFYRQFGAGRSEVSPQQNVYLKIFHTFYVRKPQDLNAFIRAYVELFPEETTAIDVVSREVLGERPVEPWPQIRLADKSHTVGTSMFDQFRGLPRRRTFDLNSASVADLACGFGITSASAAEIVRHGPYRNVDELARVPGLTPVLIDRARAMEAEWRNHPEQPGEESLSVGGLVRPYLIRAAIAWLLASLFAAAGYYIVRRGCTVGRAVIHGLAASLVGLLAGWLIDGPVGITAVFAVLIVFGVPAGLRAVFSRSRRSTWARVMAAWAAAAVPAAVLTVPWF
jgi:hypothetical protein